MLPFKRKIQEEELDIPKKKVRKKKEIIKPWGHQERLVILFFLILIPGLSLFFLNKSQKITPQVLGDVVSKSRSTSDINILKVNLTNETKKLTGTYGIWMQSLDNSYSLGINENENFDGASLFKLPLMIEYYKEVDSGQLDPNTNYSLKYSDLQSGAGVLASEPPGTIVTYQDIANSLGKNSDNTGFSILGNILGWEKETQIINDLGMNNTDLESSTTTPKDIGTFFYKLTKNNLISQNSQAQMFESLTNTDYESLIPASLPKNIRVIHKYAGDSGELNDAGIVYSDSPFILVILSKNINYNEAQIEIPKLTKIIYDWTKK